VHEVQGLKVTASLGVQAFGPLAASPALMMDHADQALYRAKRSGRNRVMVFDESPEISFDPTPAGKPAGDMVSA
jgi:PleD family two-component response regulator